MGPRGGAVLPVLLLLMLVAGLLTRVCSKYKPQCICTAVTTQGMGVATVAGVVTRGGVEGGRGSGGGGAGGGGGLVLAAVVVPVSIPGQQVPTKMEANVDACTPQGLTLVHFSAQLEPCRTQENALHTPDTPSWGGLFTDLSFLGKSWQVVAKSWGATEFTSELHRQTVLGGVKRVEVS